jgi:hypothetical protein
MRVFIFVYDLPYKHLKLSKVALSEVHFHCPFAPLRVLLGKFLYPESTVAADPIPLTKIHPPPETILSRQAVRKSSFHHLGNE